MNKKFIWLLWILLTVSLATYFGFILFASEDKSEFLIGDTTYGHYQIEMACESCHTDSFGGKDSLQKACVNCHGEDLKQAHDSHPKKKFTDPRDAYLLEIIDGRYCISCHTEHHQEQTHPMGVTLPDDYCFHCHKEIADDRESHKGLPFDSCASSGCHNFHDNRALYDNFLVKHSNQPWLDDLAMIPTPNHAATNARQPTKSKNTSQLDTLYSSSNPAIADEWHKTSHGQAEITCGDCHSKPGNDQWITKPQVEQCQRCHQQEADGFLSSKHGMRLSPQINAKLNPISPNESPLDFKTQSLNAQHGCNSCHNAHSFNTITAAVESCTNCHDDEHSLAFNSSPHGMLWNKALNKEIAPEQAVSCATCHMPRIVDNNTGIKIVTTNSEGEGVENGATKNKVVRVEHNQNFYLRPNEKMIRPVCMQCHSLEFSIDALADETLIKNNFSGKPTTHIQSIDWALKNQRKSN
jgi:hypothetical protein